MAQKRRDGGPTEKTPKGFEVPVPKRGEFFANLKKLAQPAKREDSRSGRSQK